MPSANKSRNKLICSDGYQNVRKDMNNQKKIT